jgi:nitrogen fixation NifU-like protein
MFDVKQLYRQIILEYAQNPRNFGRIRKADFSAESSNFLCGDRYRIYLKMSKNRIKNISFLGEGCLVSKASASLMTEILEKKTIAEVKFIFNCFQNLVKTGKGKNLGKLMAFSGIYKFPLRIRCALLPWYAAKKVFKMH